MKDIFIQLCDKKLIELQKDNNLGLQQLSNIVPLSDIKRAFRNITVNDRGYLCIPENTQADLILRYLEYGGENSRATHLLSLVVKDIKDLFAIERR